MGGSAWHYVATAAPDPGRGVDSNRSIARRGSPPARCMYLMVVERWTWPQRRWMTGAGAPRIARWLAKVCLSILMLPVARSPAAR